MKNKLQTIRVLVAGIVCVGIISVVGFHYNRPIDSDRIFKALKDNAIPGALTIVYPFDGTLFPPEICVPTFRWKDPDLAVKRWMICIEFDDGFARIDRFTDSLRWTPGDRQWETIKQHSKTQKAVVAIIGIKGQKPVSSGRISLHTSTDEVGAPLFYREVNLPFIDAVKDPRRIRWRFGSIAEKTCPHIVLENLPVCGNCHSFSANGKVLGMDVDYANDKGSYAIVPVSRHMTLDSTDIITWSDYKRTDKEPTFGLLSQVSPDGNWIVSTVKDLSVFVPRPGLGFSQLFFPVKGILAVYNRATRAFSSLPGASDRRFVQSNPMWSPDQKRVLFIRSKVYELNAAGGQVLLTDDQCVEFLKNGKLFLYDIYQVPFNNGKGGVATPLAGASNNGMSNYFPRYSPNGKWIVFCKARSFSLLQPDSRLYIMPAEGGVPRQMSCNRDCMNSWHSWSPNGKWLVFSSKAFSPYTQLFLTHIDDKGMDTPPVVLDRLTAPDRAANIPEFVNAADDAILRIQEHFVNDLSYVRAAKEYATVYEFDAVLRLFGKALELNPGNVQAHYDLGTVLAMQNREDEALAHLQEAIRLDSNFLMAYCNCANLYTRQGRFDDASQYYRKVLAKEQDRLRKNTAKNKPSTEEENAKSFLYAHTNLALIYTNQGLYEKAAVEYAAALKLDPSSPDLHCALGDLYITGNNLDKAKNEYTTAIGLKPDFERALFNLGVAYEKTGRHEKAKEAWQKVLLINPDNSKARNSLDFVRDAHSR
jgi:tetratricopeptide (TPR) repeat protein